MTPMTALPNTVARTSLMYARVASCVLASVGMIAISDLVAVACAAEPGLCDSTVVDLDRPVPAGSPLAEPPLACVQTVHVNDCLFSPDGAFVITTHSDGRIRLWDSRSLTMRCSHECPLREQGFSNDPVVAVHPSLPKMLAHKQNGEVGLFDLPGMTWTQLATDGLQAIFSSDGCFVCVAEKGTNRIVVRRIDTLKEVSAVTHIGLRSYAVSHDCSVIASVGADDSVVVSRVGGDAKPVAIECATTPHIMMFTPDGKTLVTAEDQYARAWDARTGDLLSAKKYDGRVTGMWLLNPEGREMLIKEGVDSHCHRWNYANNTQRALLLGGESMKVNGISVSAKRDLVCGILCGDQKHGPRVSVLCTADAKRQWFLDAEVFDLSETTFSSDGSLVAVASSRCIYVWAVGTKQQRPPDIEREIILVAQLQRGDGNAEEISRLSISPDAKSVAAILASRALVWSAETGQLLHSFLHPTRVDALSWTGDGKAVLTLSHDGVMRSWNVSTGKLDAEEQGHKYKVYRENRMHIVVSPDKLTAVTAGLDSKAVVWSLPSMRKTHEFQVRNSDWVQAVAYAPKGDVVGLASGRQLDLWNVRSGQQIGSLKGHSGDIYSCCFSNDGRRVATASSDKTAIVWDLTTMQELATCTGHRASIEFACFSSDGKLLATASEDGEAALWSSATGKRKVVLKPQAGLTVDRILFSPDDRLVAAQLKNSDVIVWEVSSGSEVHRFQYSRPSSGNYGCGMQFFPDSTRVLIPKSPFEIAVVPLGLAISRKQQAEIGEAERLALGSLDEPEKITIVTPRVAQAIVAGGWGVRLSAVETLPLESLQILSDYKTKEISLDGLRTLSRDDAREIASFQCDVLSLDGVDDVGAEVATELARYRGSLSLSGLKSLSESSALALGQHAGFMLALNGVEDVTPQLVRALGSGGAGRALSLGGLNQLPEGVAKEMSRLKSALLLDGLEELSDEDAEIICKYDGPLLSITGLKKVSPASEKRLRSLGSVKLADVKVPNEPGKVGPGVVGKAGAVRAGRARFPLTWEQLLQVTGPESPGTKYIRDAEGNLRRVEARHGADLLVAVTEVEEGFRITLGNELAVADFASRPWFTAQERDGLIDAYSEFIARARGGDRPKTIGRFKAVFGDDPEFRIKKSVLLTPAD